MNDFTMELLKVAIILIGTVITYVLVPYIRSKTTPAQRKEAEYWVKLAVMFAEQIYKEKGKGQLKKDYVLQWLNRNNIHITVGQADILIDLVVERFNKNGWNEGAEDNANL